MSQKSKNEKPLQYKFECFANLRLTFTWIRQDKINTTPISTKNVFEILKHVSCTRWELHRFTVIVRRTCPKWVGFRPVIKLCWILFQRRVGSFSFNSRKVNLANSIKNLIFLKIYLINFFLFNLISSLYSTSHINATIWPNKP